MQLRYNYRLRPTPGQTRALNRAFGCARRVFNDTVAIRREAHAADRPYPTDAEVSRALTLAKRDPDWAWLNEVSAVVLQQAVADANTAYRNFFASIKGTRKGPKIGPPRFRSKKDARQSLRFTANSRFRVLPNGRLRLPKIGDVRVHWPRDLPAAPSSVTVLRDAKGRVHASFVVAVPDTPLPAVGHEVGVDLGLTHFATLSDGTKIPNRRWFRADQRKLRRADRALARSTRTCSTCGRVGDKLDLSIREWTCLCGAHHDRDHNAALNILAAGRADSRQRLVEPVSDSGEPEHPAVKQVPAGTAA